jgi:CRISPR-associated endonuclease Cas1
VAQSGSVTIGALSLCEEYGIAVYRVNREHRLVPLVSGSKNDVTVRRLQYRIGEHEEKKVQVCQYFVKEKLRSYLEHSDLFRESRYYERVRDTLQVTMQWFSLPELTPKYHDIAFLRVVEGRYSNAWFALLKTVTLHFKKKDVRKVPLHWYTLKHRESDVTSTNRKASTPFNTLLNYGYGILAAQVEQKLVVHGFDPCAGYLHVDGVGRKALVYDVMESLRAEVDRTIVKFVQEHVFGAGDFTVTREGEVRLHTALAQYVSYTCMIDDGLVGDAVEDFGRMLRRL